MGNGRDEVGGRGGKGRRVKVQRLDNSTHGLNHIQLIFPFDWISQFLSKEMVALINKYQSLIDYIHVSDQYYPTEPPNSEYVLRRLSYIYS